MCVLHFNKSVFNWTFLSVTHGKTQLHESLYTLNSFVLFGQVALIMLCIISESETQQ